MLYMHVLNRGGQGVSVPTSVSEKLPLVLEGGWILRPQQST